MKFQDQTFRFSDAFPRHRHSLLEHHAPHTLHLTYNARGAIFQLLASFPKERGDTVLLPAYHCRALVEPVIQAGYRVTFYRLNSDFTIDRNDLASKLSSRVAATVVVHFFGFPIDLDPVVPLIRHHGGFLIEDCAHSFLSRAHGQFVGRRGDFAIFSYYKFAPSIAGGSLVTNLPERPPLAPAPKVSFLKRAVLAKRLIEQAACNAPNNPLSVVFLWLDRVRSWRPRANHAHPTGPQTGPAAFIDESLFFHAELARATIPGMCRRIVESCDWQAMAQARRRNYALFSQLIPNTERLYRALPELTEGVVPWAFPLLFEDRAIHEQELRSRGIPLFTIGEVLHPALAQYSDQARSDAESLSRRLMLLPVHPQLTIREITDWATTLNHYVARLTPAREMRAGGRLFQAICD